MAQTYKDPLTYLNEAVTRRGKSGPDGVYLQNITVVAEASGDYDCNVFYGPAVSPIVPPGSFPLDQWNSLLVNLRWDLRSLSQSFWLSEIEGVFQILTEGNRVDMNVFLPSTDVQEFSYYLQMAQDTLVCIADFTSRVAGTIRFNIGIATKSWSEMVEEGDVEERDLSF